MKTLPTVKSVETSGEKDGHMGGVELERETPFLRNQNEFLDLLWCLAELRS